MTFIPLWVRRISGVVHGTWRQMREAQVPVLAGSLSFATVLSFVPLLAVSLSVFKAYGGFEVLMMRLEPFIMQNFVEASGAHVSRFIAESVHRIQSGTLGLGGGIALFITSTKLFVDVENAVQSVWREKVRRWSVRRLLVYWIVMFGGPLVLAVALGMIGSRDLGLVRHVPHRSIAFVFTFAGFSLINKFLPSRTVSWRSVLIASAVAASGVAFAQSFYAQTTKHVLRYSKIYGSIASVPIFLIWVLVLWWICLGGVALCATLEKRKTGERH